MGADWCYCCCQPPGTPPPWSPHMPNHSAHWIALKASHLQLPLQDHGRLYTRWAPGFLTSPTLGAPSPFPRGAARRYAAVASRVPVSGSGPSTRILLLPLLLGSLTWQGNCPKYVGFSPKNKPFLCTSLERCAPCRGQSERQPRSRGGRSPWSSQGLAALSTIHPASSRWCGL